MTPEIEKGLKEIRGNLLTSENGYSVRKYFHHSVSLLISDPNPLKGPSYTKNQGKMQHCSNKQT